MKKRFDRRGLSGPRLNKGHVNGGGMLAAYHHRDSLTWRWVISWGWRFGWAWPPSKWIMWSKWVNPTGTGSRHLCLGPIVLRYDWQHHHWRTPQMDLRALADFPKGGPRVIGPEGPTRETVDDNGEAGNGLS